MSLETNYDPENIFAKIIRGDMAATKLYETDDILAFMDVFPQSEGHCLIVHKNATATNLLDIDDRHLGELISAVKKITTAVNEGLEPDGIRVMQFNGAPAGQTVYHLHFHVIPIYEGKQLGRHASGGPADAATLEPVAAKIRAALKRKLGF